MIYLKNKITGQISKFSCPQGDDWIEATASEINLIELEQKKNELRKIRKHYLVSTDWIVSKVSELSIKGEDVSSLLAKYLIELTKRTDARTQINEIEAIENIEDLTIYNDNF